MDLISKDVFYFKFYRQHIIPEYISKLSLHHNDYLLFKKNGNDTKTTYHNYNVSMFPSYMSFEIPFTNKYSRKIVEEKQIKGCAIALEKYEDIESYINHHFKKNGNFRNKIRKNIRRLNDCFNIRYEMFFGNIERDVYDFLMDSLKSMILVRCEQTNDSNFAISVWDNTYYKRGYDMIRNKKASLFVIYDGEKPVDISLNYHYNKVFFGAVSSYDIDYSKFGLGHILIYNVLDWCFKNDYQVLDMGHGNHSYKIIWCNLIYDFENYIVYKRNSLMGTTSLLVVMVKIHVRNFLKKSNLYSIFRELIFNRRLVVSKKKVFNRPQLDLNVECKVIEPFAVLNSTDLVEILLKEEKYNKLRKPVYDFLYLNQESLDDVKIFTEKGGTNKFYIKGKKMAEIVFNSP